MGVWEDSFASLTPIPPYSHTVQTEPLFFRNGLRLGESEKKILVSPTLRFPDAPAPNLIPSQKYGRLRRRGRGG